MDQLREMAYQKLKGAVTNYHTFLQLQHFTYQRAKEILPHSDYNDIVCVLSKDYLEKFKQDFEFFLKEKKPK